jgi:hypothetical protein
MAATVSLRSGWRIAGWALAAAVLAIPAIAMQFTSEVNWGPGDFLVMGTMLLALGIGLEVAFAKLNGGRSRAIAGALLLVIFLLIWAELAVGILH